MSHLTRTMGILVVVCYEQAAVFQYFSASGSWASCSFEKTMYCISFLCQSTFPAVQPCQTTMTLCFLQVAWRWVCHEPWGLTASHWITSKSPHALLSLIAISRLFVFPSSLFSTFSSCPFSIPRSLHPLSHCPGHRGPVRRFLCERQVQTTPCEGMYRGFLHLLAVTPHRNTKTCTLMSRSYCTHIRLVLATNCDCTMLIVLPGKWEETWERRCCGIQGIFYQDSI